MPSPQENINQLVLPLFRFVRVANAHNDPGTDGLKIFNIGYLAGIAALLLALMIMGIFQFLISDEYVPYTALCLKKTLEFESKPFFPAIIGVVVAILTVVFAVIITRRTYKYLNKLQDSHLRNLPAKNVLTYIDTLLLFSIISGSSMIEFLFFFSWALDILSFNNANLSTSIISIIVEDIGVGFIFPIYIIMKTKRYLPKLWDDSRQIVAENNDFFSINPATVAPEPQIVNQDMAESSF